MSYEFYKVLHVAAVLVVFLGLGGVAFFTVDGKRPEAKPARRVFSMVHGVGLLIAFVAGFGLLARIGQWSLFSWVGAKLVLWLVVGALPPLVARVGNRPRAWVVVCGVVGVISAYLAVYKPF